MNKGNRRKTAGLCAFVFAVLVNWNAVCEPLSGLFLADLVDVTAKRLDGAPPTSLRLTSPAATTSPLILSWEQSLRSLEARVGPALHVRSLHGGTVHGTGYGFKALRTGNADLATCYASLRQHSMPLSSVWGLPFVAPQRSVVATTIARGLQSAYFAPEYDQQGVTLAGQYVLPATNLLTRAPVRTLGDLRGLRIAGTPSQLPMLEALGADPVTIPFPDYYVALQRGMVDGVLWIDIAFVAYRVTEVAKYRTVVGLSGGSTDLCFARRYEADMEPGRLQALKGFVRGMLLHSAVRTDREWEAGLEAEFEAQGVQTYRLPDAEKARWRNAARPVLARWISEAEDQGKPARALLARLDALQRILAGWSDEEIAAEVLRSIRTRTAPVWEDEHEQQ